MGGLVDVVLPAEQSEGSAARVLRWLHAPGERVQKDAPLVEIETDKVTVEIAAPESGELAAIVLVEGADAAPGAVLAKLRPTAEAPTETGSSAPDDGRRALLSPGVRRLLAEHRLDAASIPGSGRGGRITRADVESYIERSRLEATRVPPPPAPAAAGRRLPHSPMRRRVAEHMTQSVATAPHVTAVFEADLTAVLAHRAAHQAASAERGAKLTLTAYFVAAAARALQAVPQVNATWHDDALELHAHCNIGVGTALGDAGLIVPVIHRAETLDLAGIAMRLAALTAAARAGRLAPEEVRSGTFTISNHGVSGSLIAAPVVINRPQVAILGVGKCEKRVIVRELEGQDVLLVRPMCYVTLTIDHRALDGYQANGFLSTLVDTLQSWPADAR